MPNEPTPEAERPTDEELHERWLNEPAFHGLVGMLLDVRDTVNRQGHLPSGDALQTAARIERMFGTLPGAKVRIGEPVPLLPVGDTGLNRAPRIITKAQRIEAAKALGLTPELVERITIDSSTREVVVTQFLAQTPATIEALNGPATGTLRVVRRYPFDAELRNDPRGDLDEATR